MGTNYFLRYNQCEHCGRYDEKHIGKSSAGWCFGLHVYPEERINTLNDWKILFSQPNAKIYNEYHELISVNDLLNNITKRKSNPVTNDDAGWLNSNYAIKGPNNLVRHRIDSKFCIGHGKGTWDYLIGYFS